MRSEYPARQPRRGADRSVPERVGAGRVPESSRAVGVPAVVLTAILEAPDRLPTQSSPERRTASLLLVDLQLLGIMEHLGADRYCLRKVPRTPLTGSAEADPGWQAALAALVGYYADRASRWAIALESTDSAAGARLWFEAEEPYLRALLLGCANSLSAERISIAAATELARTSDALDVWYSRTLWSPEEFELAARMADMGVLKNLPLHKELIQLRADGLDDPPSVYRPRGLSTSLSARWEHHVALRRLVTVSASPTELAACEIRLEAAWWLLPRADIAAQVCALNNLAIVHLHQGRLDAAEDRLNLAESLTRTGRDLGGRAHTHEILGALWWSRGERGRALRDWHRALTGYRALVDDHGTARCLQHLGSALIVASEYGSLLLPPELSLIRADVVRQASGWLAEARRLNPSVNFAEAFANEAHTELGGAGPLPSVGTVQTQNTPGALSAIDHWPRLDSEQRNG